jgi:hypothetical protein
MAPDNAGRIPLFPEKDAYILGRSLTSHLKEYQTINRELRRNLQNWTSVFELDTLSNSNSN